MLKMGNKQIVSLEKTSYQKDVSGLEGMGYKVSYKNEHETTGGHIFYENRAIILDDAWLLEERSETSSQPDHYSTFGIEKDIQNKEAVDERLQKKARGRVDALLKILTPLFNDLTSI